MVGTPTLPVQASRQDGRAFLSFLWQPGEVRELRIPKYNQYGHTASGYFDDPTKLLAAVASWDGKANLYVTLNPVNPALMARANNRIKPKAENTTSDADVVQRRWLFLDVDPSRPSGISATDGEVAFARKVVELATDFLRDQGWRDPLLAMSGNGYYAFYSVDLPNTPEATELVNRVLGVLAERFETAQAHIDTTVGNAARIVGLVGTMKVKGDEVASRPHRRSQLESVPDQLAPVTQEQLQAIANLAAQASTQRNGGRRTTSLAELLERHGIEVREQPPDAKGFVWYHVAQCPFHSDGRPFECGVGQLLPDGPLAGHCFHPEGSGKPWADWREALGLANGPGAPSGEGAEIREPFSALCLEDVLAQADEPLDAIIGDGGEGAILTSDGKGFIAGPTGIGKTNLLLRLSRCLCEASTFLDLPVPRPCRVLYVALEGSRRATARRLRKVWAGSNEEAQRRFHLLPGRLNLAASEDIERLDGLLYAVRPDVLILDPLRNAHPWDENRSDEMAALTAVLDGLIARHGCAIICAHHDRKKPPFVRNDAGTDRVRGSTALTGWVSFCLSMDLDVGKTDRFVMQWTKTRDAEAILQPLVAAFDRETIDFVVDGHASPNGKVPDTAILSAVFDAGPNGVRGTELIRGFIQGCGASERWVRERIRSLVDKNELSEFVPPEEKKGAKWYRHPAACGEGDD